MIRLYSQTIKAGEEQPFPHDGNYIRLKSAAVAIQFKTDNGDDFILEQGEEADVGNFKTLFIKNPDASDRAISYYIGKGNVKVGSAQVNGSVAVTSFANVGAATQGRADVTNVNQVLLAAKATRKYLLIQNNDASAVLRVKIDGVAATATDGFRVLAGDSLELTGWQASGAINVMMETASAATKNVEYAEG